MLLSSNLSKFVFVCRFTLMYLGGLGSDDSRGTYTGVREVQRDDGKRCYMKRSRHLPCPLLPRVRQIEVF